MVKKIDCRLYSSLMIPNVQGPHASFERFASTPQPKWQMLEKHVSMKR